MISTEEPRFRINTKQRADGQWQLDATLEYKSDKIALPAEPGQDPKYEPLGLRLLSMIQELEEGYRADGRKIVGDKDG
jgi:hypothetical protein